ncbi:MAG: hypothetical protein M0O93_02940 [Bacteroidales bacterium]|nr:hypothetical protein [Bacteroidales bacterium]
MKKSALLLTLSLLVFVFSCKEEDPITNQTGTYSSKDIFKIQEGVSSAEMAISNITHIIELAIDDDQVFYNNGITYPIITREKADPNQTNPYPMIITLDFGTDTTQGYDNRYRSGKIIARVSSHWKDSLSTIEADVQNYYMATHTPNYINGENQAFVSACNSNLRLVIRNEGITKKFENTNYPTQSITCDSAYFSTPLGDIRLSSQRYTYYISGFETPEYSDDKTNNTIESGGSASDNNNNWEWDAEMVGPTNEGLAYFSYNRNCFWLVSGNIKLNYKDLKTQREAMNIIDFGKSDQTNCDNIASYSTNGLSIVFNLP